LQALFRADRTLLDVRGPFIIRQLCLLMNPEKIFRAMAGWCCLFYIYRASI
jgi:hypothetical protein